MTPEEVVAASGSAWAETGPEGRLASLESCSASDGVYVDPSGRADGREALCRHIGEFQQAFAGHRIDLVSGVDEHDGYLRFDWKMSVPDGGQVMEGVDFGHLDIYGRLKLICGFFGPRPSAFGS